MTEYPTQNREGYPPYSQEYVNRLVDEKEMLKAHNLLLSKENARLKANWNELRRAMIRAEKENAVVRSLGFGWTEEGR